MKKHNVLKNLYAITACMIVFCCTIIDGTAFAASSTLNIYVSVSLTGPNAFEGESFKKAAELFVEEKNQQGGVLGKQLKLIVQDDAGSPETAGNNAQIAIADPDHFLTVGSPYSRIALPVSRLYGKKGLLYFSTFATHKEIGQQGPTIFQLAYNDEFQGKVLSNFAVSRLNAKNILVIINHSDPYSEDLSNEFISDINKKSGVSVSKFGFIKGELSTAALFETILKIKPDLIFVPLLREDAAETIKLVTEKTKSDVKILGSDGWGVQTEVQSIIRSTLPQSEDRKYYYSFFWHPDVKSEVNDKISQLYQSRGLNVPYVAEVFMIELLTIIYEAAEQSQSFQSNQLAKYLRSKTWDSTTGRVRFNQDGTTQRSIVILELSKQNVSVNSIMNPEENDATQ